MLTRETYTLMYVNYSLIKLEEKKKTAPWEYIYH